MSGSAAALRAFRAAALAAGTSACERPAPASPYAARLQKKGLADLAMNAHEDLRLDTGPGVATAPAGVADARRALAAAQDRVVADWARAAGLGAPPAPDAAQTGAERRFKDRLTDALRLAEADGARVVAEIKADPDAWRGHADAALACVRRIAP